MKKLNNKGFAASTLLYVLVIMMFLIVLALMNTLGTNRKNTKNLGNVIDDELNRYGMINQSFSYDENIDEVEPREVIITADGWYRLDLWDTSVKFSGMAYFKKQEQINVYLKDKESTESSYITFGDQDDYKIKHFNTVKYEEKSTLISKFSITKVSDKKENEDPFQKQTSKLSNVQYVKDCVTNSTTESGWAGWREIQIFDEANQNILKESNNFNLSFIERGNAAGNIEAMTDGIINQATKDDLYSFESDNGKDIEKCVVFDLKSEHNLSEIAVWHTPGDYRIFKNHKIYVAGSNNNYSSNILENIEKKETFLGIRYADKYKIN